MPAGPRDPYANAASHPGYQFALAQGLAGLALQERDLAARGVLYSADALYGTKVVDWRDSRTVAALAAGDYRNMLEPYRAAALPKSRLSVIRKYGFGGRCRWRARSQSTTYSAN